MKKLVAFNVFLSLEYVSIVWPKTVSLVMCMAGVSVDAYACGDSIEAFFFF